MMDTTIPLPTLLWALYALGAVIHMGLMLHELSGSQQKLTWVEPVVFVCLVALWPIVAGVLVASGTIDAYRGAYFPRRRF